MPVLIVSPRAEADLEEIWTFIAAHDPDAAERLFSRIAQQFDHLLTYPEVGRTRPELLVNLRCLPIKSYLIFYQPTNEGIEIFRVLHGSRDVEQTFDELVEGAE